MKKRIVLLLVLTVVCTSVLSFTGFDFKGAMAAPQTFERVDFISGVVTASYLNMRQGPATNYEVLSVLKKGQWVNVLAKIGDWYAVYDPKSGLIGSVSGKYLVDAETYKKQASGTDTNPAPQPEPQTTKAPPSAPAAGLSEDERLLLDLINQEREKAGIDPLAADMDLMKVSREKARDMVDKNYFSHQSPTYGSPFDMMRQFGVSFSTAGENIAGNRTIEGAVKAWMNSSGHRKNILSNNFNYTGIGIVDSPTYGKVFVQQFIGR